MMGEDIFRDIDFSSWSMEEMNLLADEVDAIISQSETDEVSLGVKVGA
jgi:hypothetical protein